MEYICITIDKWIHDINEAILGAGVKSTIFTVVFLYLTVISCFWKGETFCARF